jgi:hypothetical protein
MFGPLATIIGAVIGAAVTYFLVVKRRRLVFWVAPSEDLTSSLRSHHNRITVTVGGQGFFNLNRGTIYVENIGNTSIDPFAFDVEIPGKHEGYLAELVGGEPQLREAISITTDQPPPTMNPALHVQLSSFFNPKESFKLAVFFDGDAVDCTIQCRVADVKTKVKYGEYLPSVSRIARYGKVLGQVATAFVGTIAAAIILIIVFIILISVLGPKSELP